MHIRKGPAGALTPPGCGRLIEVADMRERKRARRGASNIERIRFYARPDEATGCWIWTGTRTRHGYGVVWDRSQGRNRKAHRVAYEELIGPIPDGLPLDHLCRNPPCCNPAHLEPVTPQINSLRGETIAAVHAAAIQCPQGHEYTPENTYSSKRGERDCRICRRTRGREWARRKRAERRGLVA
jgi:hypothetical protein